MRLRFLPPRDRDAEGKYAAFPFNLFRRLGEAGPLSQRCVPMENQILETRSNQVFFFKSRKMLCVPDIGVNIVHLVVLIWPLNAFSKIEI